MATRTLLAIDQTLTSGQVLGRVPLFQHPGDVFSSLHHVGD